MGYAALEYFEEGGDVRGLAEKVKAARDRTLEKARRRGRPEEPPIPAHGWVVGDEPEPSSEPMLTAADDYGTAPTGSADL